MLRDPDYDRIELLNRIARKRYEYCVVYTLTLDAVRNIYVLLLFATCVPFTLMYVCIKDVADFGRPEEIVRLQIACSLYICAMGVAKLVAVHVCQCETYLSYGCQLAWCRFKVIALEWYIYELYVFSTLWIAPCWLGIGKTAILLYYNAVSGSVVAALIIHKILYVCGCIHE